MSSQASTGSDPYRAWLDVRELHRPLNAYQLLRLAPLEQDEELIRKAANKQRTALELHRGEAPREIWQQVHREVETAVGILLDPEKKAAYDITLKPREAPEAMSVLTGSLGGVTDGDHATMVRCTRCGGMNPGTRKFCAHCGNHLWQTCPQCGTLCTAGEKFCGACGANLEASVRQQLEQFENDLREAERLCSIYRHEEAIELLGSLCKKEHAYLADGVRRAGELIKEVAARRERHEAEAESAYERARQAAADGDERLALQWLESIPEPIRGQEMASLLEGIRSRHEELFSIERALNQAVAEKRLTADLLPKLGRLLELRPDHPLGKKLASRFCDHVLRAARGHLDKHQYDRALEVITRAPRNTWNEEIHRLHTQAKELAWLVRDFQNAPCVDATLAEVGKRIHRMAPRYPRFLKQWEELRRRLARVPAPPRFAAAPWAAGPKETSLGMPVERLTGFKRLEFPEDGDYAKMVEHPGSFFVACGLALQGLGQAKWTINLLPHDQHGMLERVSQMMRLRPAQTAWGLDLGSSGLKAIRLEWDEKHKRVVVLGCEYLEHRKILSQAVNQAEEHALATDTLKTFLERGDAKADRVCVGLPGSMMLCRHLQLPPVPKAKLAGAIQYEARHHLPFNLDELVWGYQPVEESFAAKSARETTKILLVAVKRPQAKSRLAWFEDVGLHVDMVQTDSLALHNFLLHDRAPDGQEGTEPPLLVALDMGTDATNVVVGSSEFFWSRNNRIGGHAFTKALVSEFQLTIAQAEQRKKNPANAESFSELYEAMEPVCQEFMGETEMALAAFEKNHPGHKIDGILGLGGGFRMHGFLRFLRTGHY